MAAGVARGRIVRGEVRLYQFAAPDKKRPALVLTRNSAIAYLSTVTVAPVTSTIRGVPSEVVLNEEDGMKSPCAVNLHNAITVSQQRMGKRVAQLSSVRMNEVCAALRPAGPVRNTQAKRVRAELGALAMLPGRPQASRRHARAIGRGPSCRAGSHSRSPHRSKAS